jgi:hypothetical protein
MAVHAYLMAILFAAPVGGAADVLTDRMEETLLVSANWVLADVNRVSVVLATEDTPRVKQMFDASDVRGRIERKLVDAGVVVIAQGTETTPRLVVQIEGTEVPDSDKCVFRVQTTLDRLVMVPGRETRQLLTGVWRVGPVMNVVDKAEAGGAICDATLVQVGVFADAQKTARSLSEAEKDAPGTTSSAASYPFVASKSGKAFHRPDCRWAQNISADNLVTYQSRDEAVQSGKRPCKLCKP